MKTENKISFVTSFSKRLYESDSQTIVDAVKYHYPSVDFYIYHENSFEMDKYKREIDLSLLERDYVQLYDLFEENPWLSKFLQTSRFKDAHKIGTPGVYDPPAYWQRNGIYWFRKVVSVASAIKLCETPLLVWVDCDVFFGQKEIKKADHHSDDYKRFDESLFEWLDSHHVSSIRRKGLHTETGFVVYNLDKPETFDLVENYLKFYTSGEVFTKSMWDDCTALDCTTQKMKNTISFGGLTPDFGCPFDIHTYLGHYKRPLHKIRDKDAGI